MKAIVAITIAMFSAQAWAAEEQKAPAVKMLTPAECAQITKRSENEFYVKGTVTIGGVTMTDSSIGRNGIIFNDLDNFDVINRSCFQGRPA
jgi:hypothetical protein